jgi:hypothetical protein
MSVEMLVHLTEGSLHSQAKLHRLPWKAWDSDWGRAVDQRQPTCGAGSLGNQSMEGIRPKCPRVPWTFFHRKENLSSQEAGHQPLVYPGQVSESAAAEALSASPPCPSRLGDKNFKLLQWESAGHRKEWCKPYLWRKVGKLPWLQF